MRLTAPGATPPSGRHEVLTNVLAGLTTSFAAIALGAAFGDACGRGALVGILSAGTIAFITDTLGGTRVQCSGPTAPMTTVTTAVVAYSRTAMFDDVTIINDNNTRLNTTSAGCDVNEYDAELCPFPDHFVNIVMLLGGVLILLMGVLRVGQYIRLVPNVVISGFMNGIAVQIWQKQVIKLTNTVLDRPFDKAPRIRGSPLRNVALVVATTMLCFKMPLIARRLLPPRVAKALPATLVVIILVTLVGLTFENCLDPEVAQHCGGGLVTEEKDKVEHKVLHDCEGCIEKTQLGVTIEGFSDLTDLVSRQLPTVDDLQTPGLLSAALSFALQVCALMFSQVSNVSRKLLVRFLDPVLTAARLVTPCDPL